MGILADIATRRVAAVYRRERADAVSAVVEAHLHCLMGVDSGPLAAGPARIDTAHRSLVADVLSEHADAFSAALGAALSGDDFTAEQIARFADTNPKLFARFARADAGR